MLVVVLLCINLMAQGINFTEDNWEGILKKAKAEDKIVFVDAYTVWCAPCKWMALNVFTNDKVGELYNANFINVKMDMEKGEGKELAKRYEVTAYPTFLFINGDGELLHRGVGGRLADKFIALGESASDPSMQLLLLEQQYNKGERSPEFLTRYVAALRDGSMDIAKVTEEYLGSLDSYNDKEVMTFIYETTTKPTQKGFDIMTDDIDTYYKTFGKTNVQERIDKALKRVHFDSLEKMQELYKKYFADDSEQFIAKHKMEYYMYERSQETQEKFFEAAVAYYDKYGSEDWNELNTVAWTIYETTEDEAQLMKAHKWIEKSVRLDANAANTDTMAAICFKLGRKRKAKKWAEKSIELAEAENLDPSLTIELLKQIEAL